MYEQISTGLFLRECPGCGRHFTTADTRQIYHDRKCQKAAFERRKHAAKLKPKACIGHQLDGTPCGIHFTPKKKISQKFHSDECQKRTRYLRDRQKNIKAALENRHKIYADPAAHAAWLAGRKAHRRSIPDKISKWAHSNYVRKGKALRKARLAELRAKAQERDRLKNVEGLDLKTGLQISLLAHRFVEGASLYDMRDGDIIYPKSQDPFAALRQLQKRFSPIIEAEQARISALAGEHRSSEKALLSERLRREEAKPKKEVRR